MSFEYDEAADLMGEGMPKGNKRAGFIGLMVAKARRPKGLQRNDRSYATAQRPKNTPANFDLSAVGNPSKDLQQRFGKKKKMSVVDKSAKGRFTKEDRDELKRLAEGGNQAATSKLEEIQAAERARKGKQLVKKRQSNQQQEVTIPTTQVVGGALTKGGRKPTDNQFLSLVKTSYQATPPPQLEGFQLVFNTPTVDAFVDEATKSVVLTLRGTVPTDKKDLFADMNIPLNRLSRTDRYIKDKALVVQILERYPPDQYEIYLTGHSLGGAVVNQLKRDFPMLKDAQTYNAAFQPYDLLRQQSGQIKRKYVSTDPLYKLGGRLFQNVTVVPPKSKTMSSLGTIGTLYDTYQGHALANFEGSGRPAQQLVTESGKVHRGAFHEMGDGALHSGKTHTKSSKPLFVKE